MTNSQTAPIAERLREELERANEAIAENKGSDANSYGAGYDCGYRDGIKIALTFALGEPA